MDTYRDANESACDKAALITMVRALGASPSTLGLDECRAWRIAGKRGHVYTTGAGGFLVCVQPSSTKGWTFAKRRLAFAKVTQDGDAEGIFWLNRLPTPEEAEEIRAVIRLRKKVEYSEEVLAAKRASIARMQRSGDD